MIRHCLKSMFIISMFVKDGFSIGYIAYIETFLRKCLHILKCILYAVSGCACLLLIKRIGLYDADDVDAQGHIK